MKAKLFRPLLAIACFLAASCSGNAAVRKPNIVLIGSTPCDAAIKSILRVDAARPVDFVRWELGMETAGKAFALTVNFGEGQPNTRGFKGGGETRSHLGNYSVARRGSHTIYTFSSPGFGSELSLIAISENVFHVLDPAGRLMTGTGGWSYSLARKDRIREKPGDLRSILRSLLDDRTGRPAVFVGRTPCVNFKRADLLSGNDCLKLKWKLILHRHPVTRMPSTYKLESTVSRLRPIEGRWALVNGNHASPQAILIQLDLDDPGRTISFLVGDDNVIFLLNEHQTPAVGNEDFGFTLNRIQKTE
ncbi:MAG TPA: hypothetical protein VNA17_07420 [Pyrinomonadaceae bacterium]|nr:hypothetical protein [Pyrinomonadaceae bacterium]